LFMAVGRDRGVYKFPSLSTQRLPPRSRERAEAVGDEYRLPSLSTERLSPPPRKGGGDRKEEADEAGEMKGEDVFRRCPNDEDSGGDVNEDEAGIVVRR